MARSDKILDGLLVLHCQQGDKKALSMLIRKWHPKLRNHAYWYVRNNEIAKDIVQDSWSKIIKKITSLKNPNSFGAWALTIVTRKSLDHIKKNKSEQAMLQSYFEESKTANEINTNSEQVINDLSQQDKATENSLLNAILELSLKHQIILRLFYLEELSLYEISQILELSKGTVKSRLFYAREKLKLKLKNKSHEKQ